MMYRAWLLLFFCGFMTISHADTFEPFAGPQPLAVLVQQSPTAPVIGAETPKIAIYENGDVIYCREFPKGKQQPVYLRARLGFEGLAAIMAHLTSVSDAPDLKTSYRVTHGGSGRALFYLHMDGREVVTAVEGLTPGSLKAAEQNPSNSETFTQLLKLYSYFETVDFSDNEPWRPVYVEAMIWPFVDGPEGSLTWPKDWPDVHSNRAMKRPHGWSIFLDDSFEHDLANFLAPKNGKSAVQISGEKWSVAYRPAFPSEPVWRKAFSKIEGD